MIYTQLPASTKHLLLSICMSSHMIRLHLKQQLRYEIQNILGNLKEKVAKIRLLVAISVCPSVCAQLRIRQSGEICGSHGAVFLGGFKSSGKRRRTCG